MQSPAAIDWQGIDTVLLDMDGTLLDLRFDNWFWADADSEPLCGRPWLERGGSAVLCCSPSFSDVAGTLQWYCIEYWTRELELDIAGIKRESARAGRISAGRGGIPVENQRSSGKRVVLVTNSHPTTLAIKDEQVALTQYFDACYSSHPFDAPKENAAFWPRLAALEEFSLPRTLFVDDSLPVLECRP